MPGLRLCSRLLLALWLLLAGTWLSASGCGTGSDPQVPVREWKGEVTVYCALDMDLAEPIFTRFQRRTQIRVKPVFDTEDRKTTALVNRLIAECESPVADVFWNNEIVQTLRLQSAGVLQPYESPSAADIPAAFRDAEHHWHGFAARARVLIVHTDPEDATRSSPASVADLTAAAYRGECSMANPNFGTTLTHMAVLAARDRSAFESFIADCRANEVIVEAGNGPVARNVAAGQAFFGLTDTDDVQRLLDQRQPVCMIWPDQADNAPGMLLIPNTVAMVHGARHPDAAKQLIDFLLSHEVEQMLADGRGAQIPLRNAVSRPSHVPGVSQMKLMDVDWQAVAATLEDTITWLQERY